MVVGVVFALLLLVQGIVSFCWPRQLWNWRYKWAVKGGGEPSRAAIFMYRGTGVAMIVAAVAMLVVLAVHSF